MESSSGGRGEGRHKACPRRRVEGIGESEGEAMRGQVQGLPLRGFDVTGGSGFAKLFRMGTCH